MPSRAVLPVSAALAASTQSVPVCASGEALSVHPQPFRAIDGFEALWLFYQQYRVLEPALAAALVRSHYQLCLWPWQQALESLAIRQASLTAQLRRQCHQALQHRVSESYRLLERRWRNFHAVYGAVLAAPTQAAKSPPTFEPVSDLYQQLAQDFSSSAVSAILPPVAGLAKAQASMSREPAVLPLETSPLTTPPLLKLKQRSLLAADQSYRWQQQGQVAIDKAQDQQLSWWSRLKHSVYARFCQWRFHLWHKKKQRCTQQLVALQRQLWVREAVQAFHHALAESDCKTQCQAAIHLLNSLRLAKAYQHPRSIPATWFSGHQEKAVLKSMRTVLRAAATRIQVVKPTQEVINGHYQHCVAKADSWPQRRQQEEAFYAHYYRLYQQALSTKNNQQVLSALLHLKQALCCLLTDYRHQLARYPAIESSAEQQNHHHSLVARMDPGSDAALTRRLAALMGLYQLTYPQAPALTPEASTAVVPVNQPQAIIRHGLVILDDETLVGVNLDWNYGVNRQHSRSISDKMLTVWRALLSGGHNQYVSATLTWQAQQEHDAVAQCVAHLHHKLVAYQPKNTVRRRHAVQQLAALAQQAAELFQHPFTDQSQQEGERSKVKVLNALLARLQQQQHAIRAEYRLIKPENSRLYQIVQAVTPSLQQAYHAFVTSDHGRQQAYEVSQQFHQHWSLWLELFDKGIAFDGFNSNSQALCHALVGAYAYLVQDNQQMAVQKVCYRYLYAVKQSCKKLQSCWQQTSIGPENVATFSEQASMLGRTLLWMTWLVSQLYDIDPRLFAGVYEEWRRWLAHKDHQFQQVFLPQLDNSHAFLTKASDWNQWQLHWCCWRWHYLFHKTAVVFEDFSRLKKPGPWTAIVAKADPFIRKLRADGNLTGVWSPSHVRVLADLCALSPMLSGLESDKLLQDGPHYLAHMRVRESLFEHYYHRVWQWLRQAALAIPATYHAMGADFIRDFSCQDRLKVLQKRLAGDCLESHQEWQELYDRLLLMPKNAPRELSHELKTQWQTVHDELQILLTLKPAVVLPRQAFRRQGYGKIAAQFADTQKPMAFFDQMMAHYYAGHDGVIKVKTPWQQQVKSIYADMVFQHNRGVKKRFILALLAQADQQAGYEAMVACALQNLQSLLHESMVAECLADEGFVEDFLTAIEQMLLAEKGYVFLSGKCHDLWAFFIEALKKTGGKPFVTRAEHLTLCFKAYASKQELMKQMVLCDAGLFYDVLSLAQIAHFVEHSSHYIKTNFFSSQEPIVQLIKNYLSYLAKLQQQFYFLAHKSALQRKLLGIGDTLKQYPHFKEWFGFKDYAALSDQARAWQEDDDEKNQKKGYKLTVSLLILQRVEAIGAELNQAYDQIHVFAIEEAIKNLIAYVKQQHHNLKKVVVIKKSFSNGFCELLTTLEKKLTQVSDSLFKNGHSLVNVDAVMAYLLKKILSLKAAYLPGVKKQPEAVDEQLWQDSECLILAYHHFFDQDCAFAHLRRDKDLMAQVQDAFRQWLRLVPATVQTTAEKKQQAMMSSTEHSLEYVSCSLKSHS